VNCNPLTKINQKFMLNIYNAPFAALLRPKMASVESLCDDKIDNKMHFIRFLAMPRSGLTHFEAPVEFLVSSA
jgi:hypothetical protein